MLVLGFPAGVFGTTCWVVAEAPAGPCQVIDPGHEALPALREVLREHRLTPVSVVLTHGHMDHAWSADTVCREYGVPVLLHSGDRPLLTEPEAALPPGFPPHLLAGHPRREPPVLRDLADGQRLETGGLVLTVLHTPGHTAGSVVLHAALDTDPAAGVLFTGDTLLADGWGRGDLPGSDPAALGAAHRRLTAAFAPDTAVLSGHGPKGRLGTVPATSAWGM